MSSIEPPEAEPPLLRYVNLATITSTADRYEEMPHREVLVPSIVES